MPKEATAETVESPVTFVPLDLILDHDEVVYRELDAAWVSELASSIAQNGLDTPLIVWNGGDPENQMEIDGETHPATFLLAGQHRRAALLQFRKSHKKAFDDMFPNGIPCQVKSGDIGDALCTMLRENVGRKDMKASEIFPFLHKLSEEMGMKNKDIAKRVGKSDAWVSQMLSIKDTLGEEGVEEVTTGGVTVKHAGKAAAEMKAAAKAGKPISAKAAIAKAKASTAAEKEAGRERAEKRISAKRLCELYERLPTLPLGTRLAVLEGALFYVAGKTEIVPKELNAVVAAEEKEKADAEKAKEVEKAKKQKEKQKAAAEKAKAAAKKSAKAAPAAKKVIVAKK